MALSRIASKAAAVRPSRTVRYVRRYATDNKYEGSLVHHNDEHLISPELAAKLKPLHDIARQVSNYVDTTYETVNAFHQRLAEVKSKAEISRVAGILKKDASQVTGLDIIRNNLNERESQIEKLDLSVTPLFSYKATYDKFVQEKKEVLAMGNIPDDVKALLEERERDLKGLVDNEQIMEVEVDQDVYDWFKDAHFPSFSKRGITAEDVEAYLGQDLPPVTEALEPMPAPGPDGPMNANFPVDDRNRHSDSIAKKIGELSQKLGLGRPFLLSDLYPEYRLNGGAVESSHPLLEVNRKIHLFGEFHGLPEASAHTKAELAADPSKLQASVKTIADQLNHLEFKITDYNPPTHFRPIPDGVLAKDTKLRRAAEKAVLNFAEWESAVADVPDAPGEAYINLKLWKLFHVTFPHLANPQAQQQFLEQYDVSPGERTLDWTLSFPPPDHTFIEPPIIKEPHEELHYGEKYPAEFADEYVEFPRYKPWFERYYDAEIKSEGSLAEDTKTLHVSNIKALPLTEYEVKMIEDANAIKQALGAKAN